MLAQQRKADAAAAAAGRPPVLSADGASDAAGGLPPAYASPQDAVAPFYLQGCSYASTRVAARPPAAAADGAAAADEAAPPAPATPGGAASAAAGAQRHLPELQLEDGCSATHWLHVPAGEVRPRRRGQRAEPCQACGAHRAGTHTARTLSPHPTPARRCPEQVTLGVDPAAPSGYLWDCERGRLGPLAVPAFLLAPAPVTVAAFRRFAFEQRGYQRPELWEPAAHAHLAAAGHTMPATWSLLPADGGGGGASGGGEAGVAAAAAGGPLQLWVHMPEGSYRWEEVADCPVYVRCVHGPAEGWGGGGSTAAVLARVPDLSAVAARAGSPRSTLPPLRLRLPLRCRHAARRRRRPTAARTAPA